MESHRRAPREVWLDLATDDPLHGHQEGRFFHGYYRCYCYLPLYIFCGDICCVRDCAEMVRRADRGASASWGVAPALAQGAYPQFGILPRVHHEVVRGPRHRLRARIGAQSAPATVLQTYCAQAGGFDPRFCTVTSRKPARAETSGSRRGAKLRLLSSCTPFEDSAPKAPTVFHFRLKLFKVAARIRITARRVWLPPPLPKCWTSTKNPYGSLLDRSRASFVAHRWPSARRRGYRSCLAQRNVKSPRKTPIPSYMGS